MRREEALRIALDLYLEWVKDIEIEPRHPILSACRVAHFAGHTIAGLIDGNGLISLVLIDPLKKGRIVHPFIA